MKFFESLQLLGARRKKAHAEAEAPRAEPLFDDGFLSRLESLSLASRRAQSGVRRGERRSKKRGSGIEFADHRPYAVGDDIRFLDFGSYERHGKLLVRLFEEEEDRSLYVVVDSSASMAAAGGKKFRVARQLAAALAYVGLAGLDRVTIVAAGERIAERLPPLRGKQRVLSVVRFLERLRASGPTDLGRALQSFCAREKRRGVVVVITDLFDPHGFQAGIDVLRFNRFEPVVLHLRDPNEIPEKLRGDVRLVDVETGAEKDATVDGEFVAAWRERSRAFEERAERYCLSRGVPYVSVRTDLPLDRIVLDVLRRGGVFE